MTIEPLDLIRSQVRRALRRELVNRCQPRPGDRILVIGACDSLDADGLSGCWVVRTGGMQSALESRCDQLPFPPACFSCVVIDAAVLPAGCTEVAIAEATRVLAPEGHLFFLDHGKALEVPVKWLQISLPAGLRRWRLRRQLAVSGLHVRAQIPLTVLPARVPERWAEQLTALDSRLCRWMPVLASASLTIAHRREIIPPNGRQQRLRFGRGLQRAGRGSQWA
jgi:SAM-dependent methyltransferase